MVVAYRRQLSAGICVISCNQCCPAPQIPGLTSPRHGPVHDVAPDVLVEGGAAVIHASVPNWFVVAASAPMQPAVYYRRVAHEPYIVVGGGAALAAAVMPTSGPLVGAGVDVFTPGQVNCGCSSWIRTWRPSKGRQGGPLTPAFLCLGSLASS